MTPDRAEVREELRREQDADRRLVNRIELRDALEYIYERAIPDMDLNEGAQRSVNGVLALLRRAEEGDDPDAVRREMGPALERLRATPEPATLDKPMGQAAVIVRSAERFMRSG